MRMTRRDETRRDYVLKLRKKGNYLVVFVFCSYACSQHVLTNSEPCYSWMLWTYGWLAAFKYEKPDGCWWMNANNDKENRLIHNRKPQAIENNTVHHRYTLIKKLKIMPFAPTRSSAVYLNVFSSGSKKFVGKSSDIKK